jgi:hypothetical protein
MVGCWLKTKPTLRLMNASTTWQNSGLTPDQYAVLDAFQEPRAGGRNPEPHQYLTST